MDRVSGMNRKHGLYGTPTYVSWQAMKARCANPAHHEWHRYGGRGITVCDRWRDDFAAFLRDMGARPSLAHSLDRFPNNDGNYEPENCRWATRKQQAENATRGRERRLRRNNSSGVAGVYFQKSRGKWAARLDVMGVTHDLGRFQTKQDAADEILLAKSYAKVG